MSSDRYHSLRKLARGLGLGLFMACAFVSGQGLAAADILPDADSESSGMEGMDHSKMDHAGMAGMEGMDHSKMDHAGMEGMDHSKMDHSGMAGMEGMDHSKMDHSGMAGMDHSKMDHSSMAGMDHSAHAGMNHEMYEVEGGEQVMVMAGMPIWLFVSSAVAIIVFSFILVEKIGDRPLGDGHGKRNRDGKIERGFRFNLIKKRWIYNMVRSRWFQAVPQLLMIIVLGFLLYAGLFGNRIGNITPVAVWTIWWAGLIFAVALFGPLFCFMCPWDGIANLVSRLSLFRHKASLSLGLEVPRIFRNMYPAIVLFTLLTWAELGAGITTDPQGTALMGLGMVVMAIASALIFKKKAFCEHLCPVGRISGMYANFSPVEVRARNPRTCESCTTEECLTGNSRGYACPTGISLKVVNNATMCTMCTECVKSCDRYNVAVNIRPLAYDLTHTTATRPDQAWLCITLLSLTLFHGFSMTTAWESHAPGSMSFIKWLAINLGTSATVNFTIGMLAVGLLPIGLYWGSCVFAARLVRSTGKSARELFIAYSFSLLPVALFYHLAHNAMHLFAEGPAIVSAVSDPMGTGADYFGTASWHVGGLLSDQTIWYLQIALIIFGHLVGIVVAHRISRRLFADKRMATRSLLPMLAVMVMVSVAGLTLMALDMNMRIGRM